MKNTLRTAAALGIVALVAVAPVHAQTDFLPARPMSAAGAYLAGQEALREMRSSDAANFFSGALAEGWDNPEIVARAYVAFVTSGNYDRAIDTARRLVELEPMNPYPRLMLGAEALKQRRYAAAAAEFQRVRTGGIVTVAAAVLRAWAQAGAGQHAEAQSSVDALSGQFATYFLQTRALMADVAGNSRLAIELITRAQVAQPYDATVVEAYARILGNAGRFDDALDVIGMYEARGLSYPPVVELRKQLEAGQRPGLMAENAQAGAAGLLYSLSIPLSQEQPEIALLMVRLALYLDAGNDDALVLLADIYDGAGQHDLANEAYERVPAKSALKPASIVAMAGNLDALGDRPAAIRRLSNMIVSEPDNVQAYMLLGQLQMMDKAYLDAADTFGKALGVTGGNRPADWRIYHARGIAYERGDKFPLAEKDFLRALELNPGHPDVLNYLGYSWVDKGMNLERGLELIEQAVEAAPTSAAIIDSLGWALYRLGRYDEAVEQLERSLKINSVSAEVNDHLGDAYWQVGRKLEAKFQWNVAVATDEPGGYIAERAKKKIEGGLDAVPPPGTEAAEAP